MSHDTITINKIELACGLAHERAKQQLNYTDEQMWCQGWGDCDHYTEEAQDVFDEWYDYYLTKIEEVANDNT